MCRNSWKRSNFRKRQKDILATLTLESDCDYKIDDDSIRVYPHNDFHSKVDKLYQKIEEKSQRNKTKSKVKQPKQEDYQDNITVAHF